MGLSIIIPYHNEGRDFILTAIKSITDTIDVEYEVIVVDDHSDVPLSLEGIRVVRQPDNLGVGQAFDAGVSVSKYDNLFLMGSDIRFLPNKWASQIVEEIEKYPKSFTCTTCVGLNVDNMDMVARRGVARYNGATILMFHDKQSNPRQTETFRGIIEAKWLPSIKPWDVDSQEIPCILGAAYGVKKDWYNYVDGWFGHRKWGTLEPYISLKSWMFGGSCRIATRIETGHIFKSHGTHGTEQETLMYNKMLVATLLIEDYQRYINFLGTNTILERARKDYKDNLGWMLSKREEYKAKTTMSFDSFCEKFDIDIRKDNKLSKPYSSVYERKDYYKCHYSKSPYLNVYNKVSSYISPTDSVVELGCGTGQLMELLQDKGIAKYIGYDFSDEGVRQTKARIKKAGYEAYIQDLYKVTSFPTANVYVSVEVMEHLEDDLKVISRIPKGGTVIITVPNYLGGSHVRKFDTEEEVVERYKELLKCEEVSTINRGPEAKIFVLKAKKI